ERAISQSLFPLIPPAARAYDGVYEITDALERFYTLFARRHYHPGARLATELEQFGHLVARSARDTSTALHSSHLLFMAISDTLLGPEDELELRLAAIDACHQRSSDDFDTVLLRSSQALEALSDLKKLIQNSLSYTQALRFFANNILGPDWSYREIALREAPAILDNVHDLLLEHAELTKYAKRILESERNRFSTQAFREIMGLPVARRQPMKPFIINHIACLYEWAYRLEHQASWLDKLSGPKMW
ncbi:hypothetical protein HDZ31DRAFT_42701, partial [Schizophyllum fasciatum]